LIILFFNATIHTFIGRDSSLDKRACFKEQRNLVAQLSNNQTPKKKDVMMQDFSLRHFLRSILDEATIPK
jgi:hypothetical protein